MGKAIPTRKGFGGGPGGTKNSILGFKNGLLTRGVLIDLPLMKGDSRAARSWDHSPSALF
jgi:hypothetical protein